MIKCDWYMLSNDLTDRTRLSTGQITNRTWFFFFALKMKWLIRIFLFEKSEILNCLASTPFTKMCGWPLNSAIHDTHLFWHPDQRISDIFQGCHRLGKMRDFFFYKDLDNSEFETKFQDLKSPWNLFSLLIHNLLIIFSQMVQ